MFVLMYICMYIGTCIPVYVCRELDKIFKSRQKQQKLSGGSMSYAPVFSSFGKSVVVVSIIVVVVVVSIIFVVVSIIVAVVVIVAAVVSIVFYCCCAAVFYMLLLLFHYCWCCFPCACMFVCIQYADLHGFIYV